MEVAIIGAGPSGLAAAKYALENNLIPSIFEKSSVIGGLWATGGTGSIWNSMHTNLAYHTCSFSDFPWPKDTPDFPSQKQMEQYLKAYAKEFNLLQHIRFNACVSNVTFITNHQQNEDNATKIQEISKWEVEWIEMETIQKVHQFDYVIVASGIFSVPYIPNSLDFSQFEGTCLHSKHYKSSSQFSDKRVVVIGGAFSGAEIAADIANHGLSVTNIIRRPYWVVPRYIPNHNVQGNPLAPVDLVFYHRPPIDQTIQEIPSEEDAIQVNRKKNDFLRTLCDNQTSISSSLRIPSSDFDQPSRVLISDDYLPQVQAGKISIKKGQIKEIQKRTILFNDHSCIDADVIINCTGYRVQLDFLDEKILQHLEANFEDQLQPLLLHKCTFHPQLPGIAFIGMYRGPYFAVIELQARWISSIFSKKSSLPSYKIMKEGIDKERDIRLQKPRPQFPHGDYVGLADSIAKEIDIFRTLEGPVIAASYQNKLSDTNVKTNQHISSL